MRTLKILAMISLLFAALSVAACSGTDLSGTAGESADSVEPAQPEEPGEEPGEEPEQPEEPSKEEPSKEEPGGANEPGGSNEPGAEEPSQGGDDEPGGTTEKSLDDFLNELAPTQRVDEDYIEKYCEGCTELSEVVEALAAACAAGDAACTSSIEKMVTDQRTSAQVRNDQNLVGYPTAQELKDALATVHSGGAVEPEEPAAGGEEPSKDIPEKSLIAVVAVVGQLPADVTEVSWDDIVQPAMAAGVDRDLVEVEEYLMVVLQSGELPESCDPACVQTIKALIQSKMQKQARNDVADALANVAAGADAATP